MIPRVFSNIIAAAVLASPLLCRHLRDDDDVDDDDSEDVCADLEGGDWELVRHVPAGDTWFKATDQLRGTSAYGNCSKHSSRCTFDSNTEWSTKFNAKKFNYFLFATGDCAKWLIASKAEVTSTFYHNKPRKVLKSSLDKCNVTRPKWFRRKGRKEEPWISLTDHQLAEKSDDILYGENSEAASGLLAKHGGANVYIRKKKIAHGCKGEEQPSSQDPKTQGQVPKVAQAGLLQQDQVVQQGQLSTESGAAVGAGTSRGGTGLYLSSLLESHRQQAGQTAGQALVAGGGGESSAQLGLMASVHAAYKEGFRQASAIGMSLHEAVDVGDKMAEAAGGSALLADVDVAKAWATEMTTEVAGGTEAEGIQAAADLAGRAAGAAGRTAPQVAQVAAKACRAAGGSAEDAARAAGRQATESATKAGATAQQAAAEAFKAEVTEGGLEIAATIATSGVGVSDSHSGHESAHSASDARSLGKAASKAARAAGASVAMCADKAGKAVLAAGGSKADAVQVAAEAVHDALVSRGSSEAAASAAEFAAKAAAFSVPQR